MVTSFLELSQITSWLCLFKMRSEHVWWCSKWVQNKYEFHMNLSRTDYWLDEHASSTQFHHMMRDSCGIGGWKHFWPSKLTFETQIVVQLAKFSLYPWLISFSQISNILPMLENAFNMRLDRTLCKSKSYPDLVSNSRKVDIVCMRYTVL